VSIRIIGNDAAENALGTLDLVTLQSGNAASETRRGIGHGSIST
jgi:hypothetical protein